MVVGVTGGIATGKSTITKYLKAKKCYVIDCDKVTHDVLNKIPTIKQISQLFGSEIIDKKTNQIDRQRLGLEIFHDKLKKRRLETIMFPLIKKEVLKEMQKHQGIIYMEAPVLLESGFDHLVEKVIVVKTLQDQQINRLMLRDKIDKEYALLKINSQWSIDRKCLYADFIIFNNGSLTDLYQQIDKAIALFRGKENESEN